MSSRKRPVWTVYGVAGETRLHVATVQVGDTTALVKSDPSPLHWVHVVKDAKTPADAAQWARETYLDHLADRLPVAAVELGIVGPKTPSALARWRRRKSKRTAQ